MRRGWKNEAIERTIQEARRLKTNAILNIRFAASSITASAVEVSTYGTAVALSNGVADVAVDYRDPANAPRRSMGA